MKRRALVLVAVAIGLAAAGAGIVLLRLRAARGGTADAAEAVPGLGVEIARLDEATLAAIELASTAATIRLARQDGVWKLTAPVTFPIRQEVLASIIASFTGLVSERVVEEDPADLAPYGLQPPVVAARATMSDGATKELRLGDRTPAGSSYYLMAEGDPRVFAVVSTNVQYLAATLNDLYRVENTPIDSFYVNYVKILEGGAPLLEISRTTALVDADPEFRGTYLSVTYPYRRPKPVNSNYLNDTFLKTIAELPMDHVVDANPARLAPYGLDKPRYELIVRDETTTLHLLVGAEAEGMVYFRHVGQLPVFATDAALARLFADQKPFAWVNPFAMIVDEKAVDRFTIESAKGTHEIVIARASPGTDEGATFTVDGSPVEERAFRDFYTRLISLVVDSLHDDEVADRKADLAVTYYLNKGTTRVFRVRFVPYNPVFYAVVKNGVSDLLVNRTQVANLIETIEAFAADAKDG